MGGGKRDDDVEEESPFANLDRNVVLREARCFNDPQINAGKCSVVLTKLLYLINRGEKLLPEEATSVFFAVTKLFQAKNVHLRRLIYLFIKSLDLPPDESLIVISCLNRDMTSNNDVFRSNSIRVLGRLMDISMMGSIDRFLKMAIVDKNTTVVNSTLIAGNTIFARPGGAAIVKGWTKQLQDAVRSSDPMVEYNGLVLLYKVRKHDPLAITRIATTLAKNPPKGALAQVLLIRIIALVLKQSAGSNQPLLNFVVNSLHNRNLMVSYEAAKTMCGIQQLSATAIAPAVSVLQEMLQSYVPTQKFAAAKVLSELVTRFPLLVTPCSSDLERLLTDSNRSIATLAISTLLKTGSEANVDRLMKSITGFMSDIADEFRIIMIGAIKTLCLKFPHKFHGLMGFLSSSLREEGGYEYKKALVDALIEIVDKIPEAKEPGLDHFCEFIEDCEFPELSIKILHMLGEKGCKAASPAKFIRFVFNRVILETSSVRAAAVSTLAKFGAAVPSLTDSVAVLLKRCLTDNDDEVRDRASHYLSLLEPGPSGMQTQAVSLICHKPAINLADMEYSLKLYTEGSTEEAFNLSTHLVKAEVDENAPEEADGASDALGNSDKKVIEGNPYTEILSSIPDIASLGKLFKSSKPVEVTESETEYVVNVVKHIYPAHVLFQFNITNNMEDQLLSNVSVECELDGEWNEEMIVPETSIAFSNVGQSFVCLSRPNNSYSSGSIATTLKFGYQEVDEGEAGGPVMDDTYQLEEMEVLEADMMMPDNSLNLVEFRRRWESFGSEKEATFRTGLLLDSLQAALDAVVDLMGMACCENSGTCPEDVRSYAVNMAGTFIDGSQVLARVGVMMSKKSKISLKLAVRSEDADLNQLIAGVVR